jgi:hypothetical protein
MHCHHHQLNRRFVGMPMPSLIGDSFAQIKFKPNMQHLSHHQLFGERNRVPISVGCGEVNSTILIMAQPTDVNLPILNQTTQGGIIKRKLPHLYLHHRPCQIERQIH